MIKGRARRRWMLPAGAAVLATGVVIAVPALAGDGHREHAARPTLGSLAKQVAALRSQDAILRRRITALGGRGAVAGVAGAAGPRGLEGLQGPAGLAGAAGAQGLQGDPGPVGARLVSVTRTLAAGSAATPVVTLPGLGTVTVTCGNPASTAAVALSVPAGPVDAYTQLVNGTGAFPGGQRFQNGGSMGFVQMPLPWGLTVQLAGTAGAGPPRAHFTVAAVADAGVDCAVSVFGWVTV